MTTAVSLVIVLAISAYGYAISGDFSVLISWLPIPALIGVLWIIHLFWFPHLMAREAVGKNPISVQYTATIDRDNYVEDGDDGSSIKLPVTSLYRVLAHNDCLVIWQNKAQMHIVPRSAFESKNDWAAAKSLLGLAG